MKFDTDVARETTHIDVLPQDTVKFGESIECFTKKFNNRRSQWYMQSCTDISTKFGV